MLERPSTTTRYRRGAAAAVVAVVALVLAANAGPARAADAARPHPQSPVGTVERFERIGDALPGHADVSSGTRR
ncbi:hypothetical protein ACIO93_28270 [Streptomyces sp. NPDC087903]|uniref:hypothetical protein n=1 Tax=Streptomyces sp. NPDC087903 TaxID=3365819 RepID=UPI00380BADA9